MSSPSFRLAMAGAGFVAGAALVYAYRIYNKKPSIDVRVVAEKEAMGAAAAAFTAKHVNAAIAKKGYARVIVATGASQFDFIASFIKMPVDWSKVTFFHLDEYVGLDETHGASFRKYLRERLFSKLSPPPAYATQRLETCTCTLDCR